MTIISADQRQQSTIADWLTIERLLFGAILLIGAGVRLAGLADQPLSPQEAAGAWPAWLRAMGLDAPVAEAPASALLYSLQTLLFWLTGGGDAVARFGSVLAGIALVWLPWRWRGWIGRSPALMVALLMAIDPWLVAFSRLASGTALSLLLFGVVLTCLMTLNAQRFSDANYRDWVVLALAGGLLVTSGPLAWSLLPILAVFIWLYGPPRFVDRAESDEEDAVGEDADLEQVERSRSGVYLILLFLGALLLGSTTWLSHPQGLTHIGNSVAFWFGQFSAGSFPFSWVLLRFAAEELLLLLFALLGLVMLWRGSGDAVFGGRQRWASFLTLWLCWGIVLLLLPGRTAETLPLMSLALILAAGHALSLLAERVPTQMDWREMVIALVVALALLISIAFWGRILLASPQLSINSLAIVILLLLSLGLILGVYAAWAGRRTALWLGGLLLAGLLLIGSLSSLWQLNHSHDVAMPDGLFTEETAPDVRLLARDVATLSAQQVGDAGEIPMQVQMHAAPDPVVGWYLRDMRRLQWVLTPEVPPLVSPSPLAVTTDKTLATDVDYLGGAYDLNTMWSPTSLWKEPIFIAELGEQSTASERLQERLNAYWRQRVQPTMRWLIYREVQTPPEMSEVILWAPVPGE